MGRFKSDKQRKAVMAKLRGGTRSPVIPVILPLQMISGNVIKKGFRKSPTAYPLKGSSHLTKRKKRKSESGGIGGNVAFSYITGRKLSGRFASLKDVFKKFPKEKDAFDRVKRFNKDFDTKITSLRQVRDAERRIAKFTGGGARTARNPGQGNPPKKKKRKVKRFVQSIYG